MKSSRESAVNSKTNCVDSVSTWAIGSSNDMRFSIFNPRHLIILIILIDMRFLKKDYKNSVELEASTSVLLKSIIRISLSGLNTLRWKCVINLLTMPEMFSKELLNTFPELTNSGTSIHTWRYSVYMFSYALIWYTNSLFKYCRKSLETMLKREKYSSVGWNGVQKRKLG